MKYGLGIVAGIVLLALIALELTGCSYTASSQVFLDGSIYRANHLSVLMWTKEAVAVNAGQGRNLAGYSGDVSQYAPEIVDALTTAGLAGLKAYRGPAALW